MRIDLFEFFESTFRGLVYFFYNVVETLWVLARRPWRGATLLYRCYTQRGRQQIGGLTYLFLVFFTILGLPTLLGLDGAADGAGFSKFLSRAPKLDSDQVWITLISAVASTVLIDCVARLYFRWRIPNMQAGQNRGRQRRHRRRRIAEFEYTLVWPALLLPLGGIGLFLLLSLFFETVWNGFEFILLAWGAIGVTACAPAVASLAIRPRARGKSGTRARRIGVFVARVAAQIGVALFVATALALGAFVMFKLSNAQPSPERKPVFGGIEAKSLRCIVDGAGRLHVDVTLENPADQTLVYDLRDAPSVHINREGEGEQFRRVKLMPPDRMAAPVVLQTREPQVVRLVAAGAEVAALQAGDKCRFEGGGRGTWIKSSPNETVEFIRDAR